jgi:hypothetical protein
VTKEGPVSLAVGLRVLEAADGGEPLAASGEDTPFPDDATRFSATRIIKACDGEFNLQRSCGWPTLID